MFIVWVSLKRCDYYLALNVNSLYGLTIDSCNALFYFHLFSDEKENQITHKDLNTILDNFLILVSRECKNRTF